MSASKKNPRILIVTPEVTSIPDRMSALASGLTAKAGGLADVSAGLINALFDEGADVHVALPDYRSLFAARLAPVFQREYDMIRSKMPDDRIHLAEDRVFYYLNQVYSASMNENAKIALAFQREVINNIVPRVQPDLIHCHDWMTGLLPAMARSRRIPSLFTIHNIHSYKATVDDIEDRGIDAASFWNHLFFIRPPVSYEESRATNPVDFLASGVFASHFANVVSPRFLLEIVNGYHDFVSPELRWEVSEKWRANCAAGILNAPDPSFNPATDEYLARTYQADDHVHGKRENKLFLQKNLGLDEDARAPIFFWPSRLDPVQKGCQLLAEILYRMISEFWHDRLQVVFVANGPYQAIFKDIVRQHEFYRRVAICDFDERLERLCYGASDFVLMPSRFEPCGLPQMVGCIYGALPLVHDTGGLHDTVAHLDVERHVGNGFVFQVHDAMGLMWTVQEAMRFYRLSPAVRFEEVRRIMKESLLRFNHPVTARQYMDLYERMLDRPLIVR